MTSSKCKQCGLVNPFNAPECKRCGYSLISEDDTTVLRAIDQEPVDKKVEQIGTPITRTELPAICYICGTNDDVGMRIIKRTYTPNWVWLFLPLGILPAGIIGLIVQVKHSLSLPICGKCAKRHSLAGAVSWLSIIVCICLMITACAVGVQMNSFLAFLGVCVVIAAIAYAAGRYDTSANPRYTQFTKQRVEIDVPGWGRVVVLDLANEPPAGAALKP